MSIVGYDIGTSQLVSAQINEDGKVVYKKNSNAFYRIVPKSVVNRNAIKMTLEKNNANYIEEGNDFIVIGDDATQAALDRNDKALRPMKSGLISPTDKSNLKILKLLIKSMIGKGSGEKLVYSIPANPVDSNMDITYHETILNLFFSDLGYNPQPIVEGYSLALSELINNGVSGICLSLGAGMQNISIVSQGEHFSFATSRSGDFIDEQVGKSLDLSPSLIHQVIEDGIDIVNPQDQIMQAIAIYYRAVVKYTVDNIVYEVKKNKGKIPVYRDKVPVVIAGRLSWAKGCRELYEEELRKADLPFELGEIRVVDNPDQCVASGCLLAAQL